jgi:hypothetical protein
MTTQLRWHVGLGTAWLYAAERELAAPADAEIVTEVDSEDNSAAAAAEDAQAPFRREVAALAAYLAAQHIEPKPIFAHLAAMAPAIDARRDLAHAALTKLYGRARAESLAPPGAAAGLVGHMAACERTYAAAQPKLLDELRLRTGPLRELWEARGPGLLAGVGRRTDRSLIVEAATVALVPPLASNGGGEAYAATNVVRFEAVLANPIGRLPETVRLAWLVSQLATDQIEFLVPLKSGSARELVEAAMLPAVLEAAADLEVVGEDPSLLEAAAEAWQIKALAQPGRVELLRTWWSMAGNNGRFAAMPWNGRLSALDLMLVDEFGAP